MNDPLTERINVLARKQRAEGLTEEEKAEQQELRKQFIARFRANFRAELENIDIKEKDGSITSLKDQHDKKYGSEEK